MTDTHVRRCRAIRASTRARRTCVRPPLPPTQPPEFWRGAQQEPPSFRPLARGVERGAVVIRASTPAPPRFNTHSGGRVRRASGFVQTALSKVTRRVSVVLKWERTCAGSLPIESYRLSRATRGFSRRPRSMHHEKTLNALRPARCSRVVRPAKFPRLPRQAHCRSFRSKAFFVYWVGIDTIGSSSFASARRRPTART